MSTRRDDTREVLLDLARALNRLRPSWRDAEEFYELRSEIAGRLRGLAYRGVVPAAPRPVARPVVVKPTPPPPTPIPTPPVQPPPPAAVPDGLPVVLNAEELAILFARSYEHSGGYQNRYRRWQQHINRATGVLVLSNDDVGWIWRQSSRPWKGTFQKRTRRIFWRGLCVMFSSLGLAPSIEPTLPTNRTTPARRDTTSAEASTPTKGW